MKIGKVILSVAGATAAVCSAFAFKTQSKFNGRLQLFTNSAQQIPCNRVNVWTTNVGGTPAPLNQYFTDNQCDVNYNGNVVLIN